MAMAVLNFAGIQQFKPQSSIAVRWKDSLKRFNRCMVGLDIKAKARKRALLLYLAGPDVETMTKQWKSLQGISRQNRIHCTSDMYSAKQNNTVGRLSTIFIPD